MVLIKKLKSYKIHQKQFEIFFISTTIYQKGRLAGSPPFREIFYRFLIRKTKRTLSRKFVEKNRVISAISFLISTLQVKIGAKRLITVSLRSQKLLFRNYDVTGLFDGSWWISKFSSIFMLLYQACIISFLSHHIMNEVRTPFEQKNKVSLEYKNYNFDYKTSCFMLL